jgi:hypothetical protein
LDGTGAPSAEAIPEAPTQPQGEIHANKTKKNKEIQGKVLGFPWIPFADSGLFNGLRRIQIKIISFPFRVVFQTSQLDFPLFSSSPQSRHARHLQIRKNSSTELRFTRIKNAHQMR